MLLHCGSDVVPPTSARQIQSPMYPHHRGLLFRHQFICRVVREGQYLDFLGRNDNECPMSKTQLPDGVPGESAWFALRQLIAQGKYTLDVEPKLLAEAASIGDVSELVCAIDPGLSPWLDSGRHERIFRDMLLCRAEHDVSAHLTQAGVKRFCFLKGTATSRQLYEHTEHRPRRDIDILVHEDDYNRTYEIFLSGGWKKAELDAYWFQNAPDPFQRIVCKKVGHLEIECDIHRSLSSWTEFVPDHDGIIARALSQNQGGPSLITPADGVLHTCLHMAMDSFMVPLRSWVDIHRFIECYPEELYVAVERSRHWGMGSILWLCLYNTRRWFDTAISTELLDSLKPPQLVDSLLIQATSSDGAWVVDNAHIPTFERLMVQLLMRTDAKSRAIHIVNRLAAKMKRRLKGFRTVAL
jgi:hypothetical protein